MSNLSSEDQERLELMRIRQKAYIERKKREARRIKRIVALATCLVLVLVGIQLYFWARFNIDTARVRSLCHLIKVGDPMSKARVLAASMGFVFHPQRAPAQALTHDREMATVTAYGFSFLSIASPEANCHLLEAGSRVGEKKFSLRD